MNCRICASPKASKHNYYGANFICTSCRGFFMRSVQSELYKIFAHHPKNPCSIDSKNRRSCKKCRFDKCIESGMKIAYVKKSEEHCRKIIQAQNTLEKPIFTDFSMEISKLEEFCDQRFQQYFKKGFEIYFKSPNLFMKHYCTPPQMFTSKDIEECEQLDNQLMMATAMYHTEIDDVAKDALTLFKHNFYRFIVLIYALSYEVSDFEFQMMFVLIIIHFRDNTLMTKNSLNMDSNIDKKVQKSMN